MPKRSAARTVASPARRRALAALGAGVLAGTAPAQGDAFAPYPRKPVRMIVASSTGTSSDLFARVLGQQLAERYGQQIVVDNRPGAGGLIGNTIVSRANPDGYTLGMIGATRLVSALLREQPPYHPVADIAGVMQVATIPHVLAVAPNVHARTPVDLVAIARGKPGDLNFASLGIGSFSHIASEFFNRAAGIDVVHVPFKALTDVYIEMLLGRVHYCMFTVPALLPVLREGKLRPLAVTGPRRSGALPEVPTIAEAGLPEAQFEYWSGIVAPAGTPRRIVEQLHGDVVRALRRPDVREQFARQGAEPTADSTPAAFMQLMRTDLLRYQAIIREADIRPQ